jgi:3-methyladenine DNA glycosylase AlkD
MNHPIVCVFEENPNAKIAKYQAAYIKNKFSFLGLNTPFRRDLQRPFLRKANLPEK